MNKTRDYADMINDTAALCAPVRATFDAIRGYEVGSPEVSMAFAAKSDLAAQWAALIIEIAGDCTSQESKLSAVAYEVERIMTAAGLSPVRFSEYARK